MDWVPIVTLPNIHVRCAVEGKQGAIVGQQDERVKALRAEHKVLDQFLEKFTDAFGGQHRPSVVLIRSDAPESYRQGRAVSGLRDLLAMSVVPYKRAQVIKLGHGGTGINPLFSDAFDFYPWMVDRPFKGLILSTPALLAADDVESFTGQTTAGISPSVLQEADEPLLASLIERWDARFSPTEPAWGDTALFRSLNMAAQASRMPFGTGGTFYDHGRLAALWVSAFEILAHPGGGNEVSLDKVLAMLAGNHSTAPRTPLAREDRKLRQRIYRHLYDARNDYLHGNPVEDDRLRLPGCQWDLTQYAAPLYRLLLTEFLGLHHVLPKVSRNEPDWEKNLGAAIAERIEFGRYQKVADAALRTFPSTSAPATPSDSAR